MVGGCREVPTMLPGKGGGRQAIGSLGDVVPALLLFLVPLVNSGS